MKSQGMVVVGATILVLFGLWEPARSVEGMVSYWKLDEGSGTTAYDSVGSNHGAIDGAIWTTGIVNGALSFDGVDDFVEVPDSDLWAFGTSDYTIELWANFNSLLPPTIAHPGSILIASNEGAGNLNKWVFVAGSNVIFFHINGPALGPKWIGETTFVPDIGRWYHLATTRAGNTYTIFIDGAPVSSQTNTDPVPNANAPLTIGSVSVPDHAEGSPRFVDGLIDEAAIYNRALTPEEIQQHFQNGLNGLGYLTVEVAVDIKPETLNLKSKGAFTAFIELPEGYGRDDVDISTVECEGAPAVRAMMADDNRLIVKFDREALVRVSSGDAVELTVTGQLSDSTSFMGSDTIRVINKGGKNK